MDTREKAERVILGMDYSKATDHELRELISSLFYISYRYGYFPIEDTFFRFDVGWGCTLRSTQMLLAEVKRTVEMIFQGIRSFLFGRIPWKPPKEENDISDRELYDNVIILISFYPDSKTLLGLLL